MRPGRNDPCPCGSGRKYKRCCMASDMEAGQEGVLRFPTGGRAGLDPSIRRIAGESVWQAEAVPLLIRIEEERPSRPVALIVTAGKPVIHVETRPRLGGRPEAVAAALERAISDAARAVGAWPATVQIRHEAVAGALRPLLAPRDVAVAAVDALPTLEEAARDFMDHVASGAIWPPVSRAETWGGWDLPWTLVAQVFNAAAEFWRAAPWRFAANLQAPRVILPSGREWTACVLGNAGEEFGVSLYSDAADAFERAAETSSDSPFGNVRGEIVALTFDRTAAMPDAAREARLHHWEVAGPDAFPALTTVNTPGGGVTPEQILDVVHALKALPPFISKHRSQLAREDRTGEPCDPVDWLHPATGVRLRYAGEAVLSAEAFADPPTSDPFADMRPAIRAALAEAIAEVGEDADRDVILEAANRRLDDFRSTWNEAPQADFGGLSPSQVGRLLDPSDWIARDGPVRIRTDVDLTALEGASTFSCARGLLALAAEQGGLETTQAGNLKLVVVDQLLDRLHFEDEWVDRIRKSSSRITERDAWPLHEVRVLAVVAGLLRRRKARFEPTKRGIDLIRDTRAGHLYARLFSTCFQRFNLAYGRPLDWPALQPQIAFTLYRLGIVARDWQSVDRLIEAAVLPFARESAPRLGSLDVASSILEIQVLDRLVGFGVLELRHPRHPVAQRGSEQYRITPLYDRVLEFAVGAQGHP
jgi:SEC-C motif